MVAQCSRHLTTSIPTTFVKPSATDGVSTLSRWNIEPVGFGSHHWLATDVRGDRRFVTVDVLSAKRGGLDGLTRAFDTAHRLRHNAGLPFVVSPERTTDGEVLRPVGEAHAVAVYAIVDGQSLPSGPFASDQLRETVLRLIASIHIATPAVIGTAARDDFAVPLRTELVAALDELDGEWEGGPYSEFARGLLAENVAGVRRGLTTYDRLVDAVTRSREPRVITHGEPFAQNVMITNQGPVLIDWDTALIAPPERDLWELTSDEDCAGLDAYTEITSHHPNRDTLMLYRLWWALCEVAGYTTEFRRPHRDTEDSRVAWDNLCDHLALMERWIGATS